MRKTRVGAALLAVALLLELFANLTGTKPRLPPPEKQENAIQNRENDIDKDRENARLTEEQTRWRELAQAWRQATPATENRATLTVADAGVASRSAEDRELPSVYDPDWARGKFAHFSAEELAAMAGRCELRWQLPPFAVAAQPSDKGAEYDRVLAAAQARYRAALTALYREAGGGGAEALGLRALEDALRASEVADAVAVHRRLAGERAGDPATAEGSIYERYLRLQLAAGDAFEADLAAAVGAAQAQQWREAAGAKMTLSGCDRDHAVFRSTR